MSDPKIAAAPISWGVCEVPGWGHQLAPERVLAEMAELGFAATEFGPEGFLPAEPQARASAVAAHGLTAIGGFVPAVLHDPDHDPLPAVIAELEAFAAAGAQTLVLAAATGVDGYDAARPVLDDAGWALLFERVAAIQEAAGVHGIVVALHPHVGTMVETHSELERVLEGTEAPICFDTGHMLIGGIDPVAFASAHAGRVSHAHLKDVDLALARRVQSGELGYYDAVVAGLYRPLGQGDIDVATILRALDDAGFDGWLVLEQDNVLSEEPAAGTGPIDDARASLAFLRSVLER